jgi:hypothetical protein
MPNSCCFAACAGVTRKGADHLFWCRSRLRTLVEVTERRHAEHRLLMQYRVTRILADAVTVEEATAKILQTTCECLPGRPLGMR